MSFRLTRLAAATAIAAAASAAAFLWLRRDHADEAWAIRTLRTINGAQVAYSERCDGYAPSFFELITAGDLASVELADGTTIASRGYVVRLVPAMDAAVVSDDIPGCGETVTDYFARADPGAGRGSHFATDASGTIFRDRSTIPNPIPATAQTVD